MKSAGTGCLLLFGLVWCGFILFVDCLIVRDMAWEVWAASFPQTQGVVMSSEVTATRSSKGRRNYRPAITYRYVVDGREFTAEARRKSMSFGNSHTSATADVRKYPPGAPIPVFYRPSDPEQSDYDPGLKAGHLQVALFLTPFHAVGALLLSPFWLRWRKSRPGARIETTDDLRMTVHLPAMSPTLIALIVAGGTAFLATFATLALEPLTMEKMLAVWAAILALAAWCFHWQKRRIASGRHDLVIDAPSQTISLPPIDERAERTQISFDAVRGVKLTHLPATFTRKSRWGTVRQSGGSPQFELSLVGESVAHLISRSWDHELLRSIAETLSQSFGWPFTEEKRY